MGFSKQDYWSGLPFPPPGDFLTRDWTCVSWISYDAAAKSLQSCPTLYAPLDGSPPGSAIPGILQTRTLEWAAVIHESEKWKSSHSVMSDSSRPHGVQPTRLFCPWDFPGKSTGVGCHCLLCISCSSRQILYHWATQEAHGVTTNDNKNHYYYVHGNLNGEIARQPEIWSIMIIKLLTSNRELWQRQNSTTLKSVSIYFKRFGWYNLRWFWFLWGYLSWVVEDHRVDLC